ncbi:MAG TPA: aminotransferase class V-fold PLP-dependent enzyme, partial [Trebonia sp.]|nr:aminotransferase class V-fold PLP-dependent enzyme [Trebonia sp.]
SPQAAVRAAGDALAAAPAGPRLLVVTAASNVTGELWPVAELARIAHRHGARIAVDVAQLIPHRAVSLDELGLDYIAFSGHKLYAPFGAGCLVGRADWPSAADPYLYGGGATAAVDAGAVRWAADPAQRHEAGTPNVAGAVAIAAACAALADREPLVAEEERLLARLRRGLAATAGVTDLSLWETGHPRVGIVAFTVDGWDAAAVAGALADGYGIGVRDGRFCAHLLVDRLAGHGGAAVRASIGLGTTDEHVDRLLGALAALSQAGRPVRPARSAGPGRPRTPTCAGAGSRAAHTAGSRLRWSPPRAGTGCHRGPG